ncbi:hypothetical protein ACP26L_02490 [Paenibacillus sp. S-38]|uniref:hypothetical protein n=1 Tax=Paenibacillus sp. S-38 TaxID=3416710 RepID=UPI003CF414A3
MNRSLKKNGKVWKTAVPLALGGVLLVTGGMSAMAGTSGYEAYKAALKQQHTVQSVTADVEVTVKDNGQALWQAVPHVKLDKAGHRASGEIGLGNGAGGERLSFYAGEGEGLALKNSTDETYYVVSEESKAYRKHHREASEAGGPSAEELEGIVDALAGGLKQQMTLDTKPDGSRQVELQLSAAQIPPVVQTLGALAVKHAGDPEHRHENEAAEDLPRWFADSQPELPSLTQDIRIESFHLKAYIGPDGLLQGQVAELKVDGKDASGADHELALTVQVKLSGHNATAPDTVDLTGKPVRTLEGHEGGAK